MLMETGHYEAALYIPHGIVPLCDQVLTICGKRFLLFLYLKTIDLSQEGQNILFFLC